MRAGSPCGPNRAASRDLIESRRNPSRSLNRGDNETREISGTAGLQPKGNEMRIVIILALILLKGGAALAKEPGSPPNACKVCSDQRPACMKNYAGPTCKTEFQICVKSCRKDESA